MVTSTAEHSAPANIEKQLPKKYRPPWAEGTPIGRLADHVPGWAQKRKVQRGLNEAAKRFIFKRQQYAALTGREPQLAIGAPGYPDRLGLKEPSPEDRVEIARENLSRLGEAAERAQAALKKAQASFIPETRRALATEVSIVNEELLDRNSDLGLHRAVLILQDNLFSRQLVEGENPNPKRERPKIVVSRSEDGEYTLTVMQGKYGREEVGHNGTVIIHPDKEGYNMTLEQYVWAPPSHLANEAKGERVTGGYSYSKSARAKTLSEAAKEGYSRLAWRDENGRLTHAVLVKPLPVTHDEFMSNQDLDALYAHGRVNQIAVVAGRHNRNNHGEVNAIGVVPAGQRGEVSSSIVADVNAGDPKGFTRFYGNQDLRNAYLEGKTFRVAMV